MFRRPVHPTRMHKIKERRMRVSELLKQRYKQFEMGDLLGVDRSTISKDIKAIHKEWMAQSLDNLHIVRLRELVDLDDMEKICIQKLAAIKSPTQGSRWMEERRKIKERRARLLGLDAEQRYSVKREITIITKEKRDAVVLAALGGRLPKGIGYHPQRGFSGDGSDSGKPIDAEFKEISPSDANKHTRDANHTNDSAAT